jgi:molybdate transport system substrate-binding protein
MLKAADRRRVTKEERLRLAGRDRSPVLAIRTGATKPDIRTVDALKRTLLASTSITYAREGAGSVFFAELVRKLDLADALKSKIKPANTGVDVGASVARGEADLGVLPVSEILPLRGVEVLGTFPAEVRGYLVMVAGMSPGASQGASGGSSSFSVTRRAAGAQEERHGARRIIVFDSLRLRDLSALIVVGNVK